jgi:nucleotide-binding universal stress UspA family protein
LKSSLVKQKKQNQFATKKTRRIRRKEAMSLYRDHKKIFMVAIDGSEGSDMALSHTLDLLKKDLDDLILIHIRKKLLLQSKEGALDHKKEADELLKKYADRAHSAHVKHVQVVCEEAEDVREEIVTQAKYLAADYLVLGSRGLTKISRMVVGSVSDFCVHHAPCPVLIVREKAV